MNLDFDKFRIRSATDADLQSLANLETQTVPCPWPLTHYETAYSSGNALWLIFQEDAQLGDILLGAVIVRTVADEAEILNCFIGKPWQGKGVASYLFSWLLRQLAQAGVERCFLEVRASNSAAQALYRRMQFETVGRRRSYYPPEYPSEDSTREDAIVMACSM